MITSLRIAKRLLGKELYSFFNFLLVQVVELIRIFFAQNSKWLGNCLVNNLGIINKLPQKIFPFALRNFAAFSQLFAIDAWQ